MDLGPYAESIEEQLTAAAALGNDDTRQTAATLAAVLEPACRLALMEALADLAAEVTAALDDRVVEVRLDAGDVHVVVGTLPERAEAEPEPEGAETSRITLRLPEELKRRAELAAARERLSLNTWLVRTVRVALGSGAGPGSDARPGPSRGSRVRGWVQA